MCPGRPAKLGAADGEVADPTSPDPEAHEEVDDAPAKVSDTETQRHRDSERERGRERESESG